MRFRAVRIRVETSDGLTAEFFARFDDGLVIVTGHNSIGKSLLFQSLIYGLGLEGMYVAGNQLGLLTRAVTEQITIDGSDHPVRRSSIAVEIANGRNEILTAERHVVGADTHLVATWEGPVLTSPAIGLDRHDYFVRRPRAAVAEAGFHHLLARFMNWDLPEVPTFGEGDRPLYLELLFPLFTVEQKSGWAGVLPKVPTNLQVRDPLQRGIEFFLDLKLVERARQMQRLIEQENELHRKYTAVSGVLETTASIRGARIVGLQDWNGVRRLARRGDSLSLRAEALQGEQWVTIEDALARTTPATPEPAVEIPVLAADRPNTQELEASLNAANERLRQLAAQLIAIEETIDMIHVQLGSMRTRIASVDEEKRRYEELQTLVSLGSPVAVATFAHRDCPTCQQSLDGLEHQPDLASLDYAQSLVLLTEQVKTLRALQADGERSVQEQTLIRASLERAAEQTRREIRAIRADLVTPEDFPSIAQLQERLEEDNRRLDLQRLTVEVLEHSNVIDGIVAELARVLVLQAELGGEGLLPAEQDRLDSWTNTFRNLLEEFEVTTLPITEIELPVSGKPYAEGFGEVGFQASASDNIRIRWAYLFSLMLASLESGGPHPGLIMMDEPQQQKVEAFPKLVGFAASLENAQVLLITSEPTADLLRALEGTSAQIIELDRQLLQPVEE
jgi:hypothetical protein